MLRFVSFTRSTSRSAAGVALVAAFAACSGSVASPGGSTGSGGSTSHPGTGGGGADAGPPACTKLVRTGDLVRVPTTPGTMALQPRLAALAGGRTAVIATIYVPGMGPTELGAVNLDWTTGWPPVSSMPVALADPTAFVAPVGRAAPQGIPLLAPGSPPGVLAFGFADPQKGGWSKLVDVDPQANHAAFLVADGTGAYFVGTAGYTVPGTYATPLHVAAVGTTGTPMVVGPVDLGCPTESMLAAAVATDGGWLLARRIPQGGCPIGLTSIIQVSRFTGAQQQPGEQAEITGGTGDLTLLPRPGGAWLLYPSAPDVLLALRLDAHAKSDLAAVSIAPSLAAPFVFAADALDGGFVVVVGDGSGSSGALTVQVADDHGATIASADLPGVPVTVPSGTLAFDPQTRQVLVAVAMMDDAGPYDAIHVARFSCQ